MPRPTKEETLSRIHDEALREFEEIQSAVRDERLQCLQDRRFYSIPGAQWEGLDKQFENKPKFEVNKVHLGVIRIINEYRNNRITVNFLPKDGSDADDLADACNDLYRADERKGNGEEAYDNAFEEGVGGGIGAWRLRATDADEYDEENEYQHICLEPIYDADSCVFWDCGSKRQDHSDAKRCYVLTAMTRTAYEAEYDDLPASWPKEISQLEFDWSTLDTVYVAEYYRVEESRQLVQVWKSLDGEEARYSESDFEDDPELERRLLATGSSKVREKRVKRKRVHKYLLSGGGVLEDCGYIAGPNIPIVMTYGKRWIVDGIERAMGHARLPKDTQRLGNMQRSKLAEIMALSSVEKPILTPEQIAGHQLMWAKDNVENYPYLLVNPVIDPNGQQAIAGPVSYTKVPDIPPAMAALLQITEQDMKDLLGNQEQGEEMQQNISGVAVELIQNRLDMQTFIYLDNAKQAVKRSGEIWLGMARELLVEQGRKMKGVTSENKSRVIELLRPRVNPKTGKTENENDLARASFDVEVSVGPASASRRAATVRALAGMASITEDPQTKQILTSMAMMNMEGEGIEDARAWFRKRLIGMGVIEPTEEEARQMKEAQQNQQPDPQAQYLEAAAEQARAEAVESQATTVQRIADAEKKRAEAQKVLEELDSDRLQQILDVLDRLAGVQQPQPPRGEG